MIFRGGELVFNRVHNFFIAIKYLQILFDCYAPLRLLHFAWTRWHQTKWNSIRTLFKKHFSIHHSTKLKRNELLLCSKLAPINRKGNEELLIRHHLFNQRRSFAVRAAIKSSLMMNLFVSIRSRRWTTSSASREGSRGQSWCHVHEAW